MRGFRLFTAGAAIMCVWFACPVQSRAQVSGAIFTTDSDCVGTDLNIYGNKRHVYLDGGPRRSGSRPTTAVCTRSGSRREANS